MRYKTKAITAYVDYIGFQLAGTVAGGPDLNVAIHDCTIANACDTASAIKLGGKFSAKAFSVALQYETIDTGEWESDVDYIFAAGTFNINANNSLIATYGMVDYDEASGDPSIDTDGYALAYNHKMSKMTNVYVGYGAMSSDLNYVDGGGDESMFTAGIKKKF